MHRTIFFSLLLFLLSPLAHAELILTAPPRETPAKGMELYGPIAKLLSDALGEAVVYRHPGSWAKYAEDMRKDKYDIVFDGPHFAAWRIKHLNHRATGKLPGELAFVTVTSADNKDIKNVKNLRRKRTCGLASPNLGTVIFLSQFGDSSVTPDVEEIQGGFGKVVEALKAGRCDAAIMRDTVWKKLSDEDKKKFKVIHTSKPLPNQVFTAGARVKKFFAITDALTSEKGAAATAALLERFSKNAKKILAANTEEYRGAEKYLEGVIWGW